MHTGIPNYSHPHSKHLFYTHKMMINASRVMESTSRSQISDPASNGPSVRNRDERSAGSSTIAVTASMNTLLLRELSLPWLSLAYRRVESERYMGATKSMKNGPANQFWRISPGSKMVGPISIFQEFGVLFAVVFLTSNVLADVIGLKTYVRVTVPLATSGRRQEFDEEGMISLSVLNKMKVCNLDKLGNSSSPEPPPGSSGCT
ncbi:hypothetical protein EDD22DRAFT_1050293 [Suillus occidentalis]|nr:hypothetical protein EDD22DRAFT_1050293 [Suillus occidentalis]